MSANPASPKLPTPSYSPWDDPTYLQTSSPRFQADITALSTPHSASLERDRRRPRFSEHRANTPTGLGSNLNGSGPASAGIQKRSAVGSTSTRRNSQARLSGSVTIPPSGASLSHEEEANDELPIWQKKLASNSSRASSRSTNRAGSRRNSQNFEKSAQLEAPPASADASTSVSASSASALSFPEDDVLHDGRPHRYTTSQHYYKQQENTLPEERQSDADLLFSLDPLLQALTPASAPLSYTTQSFDNLTSAAYLNTADASHRNLPLNIASPRSRSGSRSSLTKSTASIAAGVTSLTRKNSLTRRGGREPGKSSITHRMERPASTSRESTSCPPGVSQRVVVSDQARANRLDASALLQRVQASQEGREKDLLILDVRPLQVFVGNTEGRLRGSVNVNFPSLLIKRFRKGNTGSFALESFVTTQTSHNIYSALCSDGDLVNKCLDTDVCIIDNHITDKDFDSLANDSSVGALLVSVLEKRRLAVEQEDSVTNGKLWYLQGSLATLINEAEKVPGLVARGVDDGDDRIESPYTHGVAKASPSDSLPTPTFASAKLTHSLSDNSIEKVSSAKQKALALPHLSLSISSSKQAVVEREKGPIPHTPGLFRSQSESQALPQQQGQRRRPVHLERIDTSMRLHSEYSDHHPQQRQSTLNARRKVQAPSSLAPPRSFQEVCMVQAKTPTKATFASAGGINPANKTDIAYGSDDYANGPSQTPSASHFGHSRSVSTDNNRSNMQCTTAHTNRSDHHTHVNGDLNEANGSIVPFSVSIIIPGFLYLGPEPIKESDVEELESIGIKRILNMAVECETQEKLKGRFEKIATIPMRDSLAEVNVQDRIREACILLDDADLHGKPTYVHCKAGKSRSVTIVLAYLVHR